MRHLSLATTVLLSFLVMSCESAVQNKNSDIKKPYLDQKPPSLTPEPFAPGIISTANWEYGGVFSQDMKEFYVLMNGGKYDEATFVMFKYEDDKWQESVISPHKGQPFISPDGMTMHLGRRYMKRTNKGWSEIKDLEAPFSNISIMRLTASSNGTYYFDTFDRDRPDFPLRYSRLIDGEYEEPRVLSKNINTGVKNINHPFIAPDESYLIWDAVKEDGFGSSDLYISFRLQDGAWGDAINLGDQINTDAWEASASITPDGKYLFFHRNMGSDKYENVDIFWVDSQIIRNLKPD